MPNPPALRANDDGVYYVYWTEAGAHGQRGRSKRASLGTKDMAKAQGRFARWLIAEQQAPAPGGTLTVADLWDVYYAKHVEPNVVSYRRLDFAWNNLKGHFGHLKPREVSSAVEGVKLDNSDGYIYKRRRGAIGSKPAADSSIRRELASLVAMLNWCAKPKRKLLDKADLPDIDLPSAGDPADRWLTHDEIKTLFAAAEEMRLGGRYKGGDSDKLSRLEKFLWLALETSKRKTAICELTWPRVDFETKILDFDVPGRKKTKKRRGAVPISKTLLPVLQRMYAERDPASEHVIGHGEDVYRQVVRCARRARLKGVTPKVLRHTAATLMLRSGVPIWTVAGILKNTVAMVEKVYGHHVPDGLRAGVEMISGGVVEMGK